MKNNEIKNIVDECCRSMKNIDLEFYSEEVKDLIETCFSLSRIFYDKGNFNDNVSSKKLENLLYGYTSILSSFRKDIEAEEAKMKNILSKYEQLKKQK